MTPEEKQILLIDLCARLPYGIYGQFDVPSEKSKFERVLVVGDICGIFSGDCLFKPYLRPMSSMTEEEKEEFRKLSDEVVGSYGPYHREFTAHCVRLGIKPGNPHECVDEHVDMDAIDWLNAHHFDYRGLIPMGLALEAPEGMYEIE